MNDNGPESSRPPSGPPRIPVILDARVVTGVGGGPEKTILNSPRFLEAAGYRMLCAYMHPPEDPGFVKLQQRADALAAPLLSVPDRGPWDWRVVAQFLEICRRERVSIWHGHDYKSNLIGLLIRPFWPMALVTTAHGWVQRTRRTPIYYGIDRLCLSRYERVICVSDDLHQSSLACGVSPDRCLLIENGIDTGQFTRRVGVAEAKYRLGIAPERIVVGAVGRLSPEKGFDVLIRAADRLVHGGLDVELWIVGEGDDRRRLEALIDELGRADRFRLLGYHSETIALYEAMDVFALSSYREGLPNVLLESMALEVPIVATRVAGIPKLVRHGENGLLVDAGSVEGLAGALDCALRDENLRAAFAHAGRETVEMGYSFAARMEKIAAVYDEILGRLLTPAHSNPMQA